MISFPASFLARTLRRLRRRKLDSLVKILGLGVGLACAILIMLWTRYEKSYDHFHAKAGEIFRLVNHGLRSGEPRDLARVPGPMGPALKAAFPEIREAVRVQPSLAVIRKPGPAGPELRVQSVLADPAFFELFDFFFVRGDRRTALLDPSAAVLSEKTARALFGSEDPIGRTVEYGSDRPMKVAGIIRDIPENSHLQFEVALPFATYKSYKTAWIYEDWRQYSVATYLWIPDRISVPELEKKITAFAEARDGNRMPNRLWLQPLTQIHLDDRVSAEDREPGRGDAKTVGLFSLVAFLILLMACLNYTNLSAAQAFTQAKEVGVRKVNGASRWDLVRQFLAEAGLTSGLALAAAIGLASWALPLLRNLTGRRLDLSLLDPFEIAAGVGLIGATTVILAGLYPALTLSSLDPVKSLKMGPSSGGSARFKLRRVFLLLQFVVTAVLLGTTGSILRQLRYVENKDLGFDRRNIIEISGAPELDAHAEAWKDALLRNPRVLGVSNSQTPYVEGLAYKKSAVPWEGQTAGQNVLFTSFHVDYDFMEAYGVKLAAGRFFSSDRPGDRNAVLLNVTAVRAMGLRDPIGTRIFYGGRPSEVIGVIEDFHVTSLRQTVDPAVYFLLETGAPLTIRLDPAGIQAAIKDIESLWRSFVPGRPFQFRFLDEILAGFYVRDVSAGRIMSWFAGLALVVALLGLYGLVAFQAERKTREIGIRKVMGASASRILALLSEETAGVLLAANILSIPPVILISNRWLRAFAYRIDVAWWQFGIVAGFLALVTGTTIAVHILKAARKNPVESLRTE